MARRSPLALTLLALTALACTTEADEGLNQYTSSGSSTGTDDDVGTDSAETGESASTGDGDGDGDGDTAGDGDGDTGDGDGDTMDSTTGDPPEDCMTPADQTGSSCGAETGFVGAYAVGESDVTAIGAILETDNGLGNGREDWYRFDFPLDAMSPRPAAGVASISFSINGGDPENPDYRFEIYRDCGAEAYGQGLAAEFGSNAPPLTEWDFRDLDPGGMEQLEYLEMVPWPTTVWIRVFRVNNDGICSNYQLEVSR